MFKSIKYPLFFSFIIVALLVMSVIVLTGTSAIRKVAVDQTFSHLESTTKLAKDDFTSALLAKSPGIKIQNMAKKASKLTGARVTVVDLSGKVVADSDTDFLKLGRLENHRTRKEIIASEKKGIGKSIRYSATIGKDFVYVAVPIKDKNKIVGFLRFSVPSNYASSIVTKVYKSSLFAFCIAIFVSVLLSLYFSKYFSDPIIRISSIAKKIANGEFPKILFKKSLYEMGELEDSVEKMSQNLKETFNSLFEERKRADSILSGMTEGVLAVDGSGYVILVNPASEKLFQITSNEALGKTVRQAIKNNEIADIIEKAIATGEKEKKELSIISPADAVFEAQLDTIRDNEGDIIGVVCVLYDITELRKLENYRKDFVANVSHELKTPLTSIKNYVETLLNGAIDDKENNISFLKKIEKNANNLEYLINDILDISKLENKKDKIAFAKLNAKDLVLKAFDLLSGKGAKKDIKFSIDCGDDLYILGIEDYAYRALLNVLDNAINYTEPGGSVSVKCSKERDSLKLSVSDSGIGISKEDLGRIFERFYRVDKARSRDAGGTGLGLSIVKHIMNLHEGLVEVESVEGKGSVFTLVFKSA